MSNPRIINSANIKQFGFKTVVDLETRKIKFDIAGLTIFEAGGALAVKGINFEVTDPAGAVISAIDFPNKDIDPAVNQTTFELPLTSGIALFDFYTIRAVIKDADNSLYEIALDPKKVTMPKGYSDDCPDGMVKGSFDVDVDCQLPRIRLSETTSLTYQGKEPYSKTAVGKLYYPRDTVAEWSFSKTPVSTKQVYTGDYIVRNKTIALYDLGDNFFVSVSYATSQKFDVTCGDKVCDVLCCIEDKYNEYKANCANARGERAKELLNAVSIPLLAAISKERCGKDASAEITEIKTLLGCDACGCSGSNKLIQPSALGAAASNLIFSGEDAATVTQTGDNVVTKVKFVVVAKKDILDTNFTIDKVEDDHSVTYKVSYDYKKLTTTILNEIKNDITLQSFLSSLIINTGVNPALVGLDGKCVISTTANNYTLVAKVQQGWHVVSVAIDIDDYPTPNDPTIDTVTGLAIWLNSLNKGVFDVQQSGDTLLVTSAANLFTPVYLKLQQRHPKDPSVFLAEYKEEFIKSSKSVTAVVQAVIDYLCALTTLEVKLGTDQLKVCSINQAGRVVTTQYGSQVTLQQYLIEQSTAFCQMVTRLAAVEKIDCAKVKALFVTSSAALAANDTLMGTKSGNCASIEIKELAIAILKLAQTDADVNAEFCKVTCTVAPPVCADIKSFTPTTILQ